MTMTKTCPQCAHANPVDTRTCPRCWHDFEQGDERARALAVLFTDERLAALDAYHLGPSEPAPVARCGALIRHGMFVFGPTTRCERPATHDGRCEDHEMSYRDAAWWARWHAAHPTDGGDQGSRRGLGFPKHLRRDPSAQCDRVHDEAKEGL